MPFIEYTAIAAIPNPMNANVSNPKIKEITVFCGVKSPIMKMALLIKWIVIGKTIEPVYS